MVIDTIHKNCCTNNSYQTSRIVQNYGKLDFFKRVLKDRQMVRSCHMETEAVTVVATGRT